MQLRARSGSLSSALSPLGNRSGAGPDCLGHLGVKQRCRSWYSSGGSHYAVMTLIASRISAASVPGRRSWWTSIHQMVPVPSTMIS